MTSIDVTQPVPDRVVPSFGGRIPTPKGEELRALLEEVAAECRPLAELGAVADYIPALATVPPDRYAIAVSRLDGDEPSVGTVAAGRGRETPDRVEDALHAARVACRCEPTVTWHPRRGRPGNAASGSARSIRSTRLAVGEACGTLGDRRRGTWAYSSVGRAAVSKTVGRGFESFCARHVERDGPPLVGGPLRRRPLPTRHDFALPS